MLLEHPLICFETLCTKEWHKLFSSSGFLEQFYRSIFWLINLERNCLSFNFPIISTICIINSRFPFFDLRTLLEKEAHVEVVEIVVVSEHVCVSQTLVELELRKPFPTSMSPL